MDKKLYPFKFISTREDRPWGTEAWAVADLGFVDNMVDEGWLAGNTLSELVETYLERVVGETSFEFYGTQFPVMVKFLDVRGRTSLHVNTDDTIAKQRYDTFGKTALWYVVSASDDARIYLGWNRDLTGEELFAVCSGESVDSKDAEFKEISDEIEQLIADSVADIADDDGFADLSDLGNLLIKKQPDFDSRNFGFAKLTPLIRSLPRFEIDARVVDATKTRHIYLRDKEA